MLLGPGANNDCLDCAIYLFVVDNCIRSKVAIVATSFKRCSAKVSTTTATTRFLSIPYIFEYLESEAA